MIATFFGACSTLWALILLLLVSKTCIDLLDSVFLILFLSARQQITHFYEPFSFLCLFDLRSIACFVLIATLRMDVLARNGKIN